MLLACESAATTRIARRLCIGRTDGRTAQCGSAAHIGERANRNSFAHFGLAAALALLGSLDEANAAARSGFTVNPSFTIRRFRDGALSEIQPSSPDASASIRGCAWPGCLRDDGLICGGLSPSAPLNLLVACPWVKSSAANVEATNADQQERAQAKQHGS